MEDEPKLVAAIAPYQVDQLTEVDDFDDLLAGVEAAAIDEEQQQLAQNPDMPPAAVLPNAGIQAAGPKMPAGMAGRGRGLSCGPGGKKRPSCGPGKAKVTAPMTPKDFGKVDAMGRPIQVIGIPCAFCGEMIAGQVTYAIGKSYHPEHFNCFHCGQPFKDGKYIEHEGQAYCADDWHELFGKRCDRCNLPIRDKAITLPSGKSYHSVHFTCTGCGEQLGGQQYSVDEGDPFCQTCFKDRQTRHAPLYGICQQCKKPIYGEFVTLEGERYHAEHFNCNMCQKVLVASDTRDYQGKFYCTPCYKKLVKDTCYGCKQPIFGRSVTGLGHVWHPEHFVCEHCRVPFFGATFRENEGKAYCEEHYKLLFCNPCAKCLEPCLEDCLTLFGKFWHKRCFTCSACEKSMLGQKIRHWEEKMYCPKCFEKLPREVRKEIEKLAAAEKKLMEKRAAQEKKEKKAAIKAL